MSRDKNSEESDRRGLVEEGTISTTTEINKDNKLTNSLPEAQWVPETIVKPETIFKPETFVKPETIFKPETFVKSETIVKPETSIVTFEESANTPVVTAVIPKLPKSTESVRPKPKRLLDRRPSTVNLTIELVPTPETRIHPITPTHECMTEEYLLTASKVLTRAQLKKIANDPVALYKEFWDVPQNYPDEVEVCGSGVKNRYAKVLPNSRSRVLLPGGDDPLATYINANYIRVNIFLFSLFLTRSLRHEPDGAHEFF